MSQRERKYAGAIILGLLLVVSTGSAQDTPSKETPSIHSPASAPDDEDGLEHGKINTADASPVDSGHVEIETSYFYAQSRHSWDNDSKIHDRGEAVSQAVGLAATAGVIDNLDVNISGSYSWLRDKENDFDINDGNLGPEHGQGFSDLNISGRYRFYSNKELSLEVAYICGFTVPTGSSANPKEIGTSQEYWSFNQTLVATKDWGKWTANFDIGYALPFGDKREDARGIFKSDVAVGYQVLPWLQPEIELNYNYGFFENADDTDVIAATVGLVMPINKRLRINTGVQQGLWGKNADQATSLYAAVKLAF